MWSVKLREKTFVQDQTSITINSKLEVLRGEGEVCYDFRAVDSRAADCTSARSS